MYLFYTIFTFFKCVNTRRGMITDDDGNDDVKNVKNEED